MTKVPTKPSGKFLGETGASPHRRQGYGPPPDQESPQSPEDKRGPKYEPVVRMDWRRGGGKGQAEGKPSFDKGRK